MTDRPKQGLAWFVFATTLAALALSLAITGFMVYLSISYATRTSAYDSAPICSSPREIAACRYEGSALVQSRRHANTELLVDLVFTGLPGKTYTAYFPQENESRLPAMQQESNLGAELWHGRVTVVAGARTLDNPDTLPTSGPPVAAFFGLVTLVVVGILVYLVREDRRATGRPQRAAR